MSTAPGSATTAGFRTRLQRRFRTWINRRIPPSRSVTLNQKRLFIFPSRAGLFYGICLLVMLLAAINFQNNLSYALTFLLATLFVLAVLHTFANLSGLTIRAVRAQPAFPGQQTEFELQVSRGRRREYYGVYCRFENSATAGYYYYHNDCCTAGPVTTPITFNNTRFDGNQRAVRTYARHYKRFSITNSFIRNQALHGIYATAYPSG